MKIILDKTYLKYSAYTVATATILYIMYGLVSNFGKIMKVVMDSLGGLLSVLTPLTIALIVTYLLHPLVSWIEKRMFGYIKVVLPKAEENGKARRIRRTLSVLITYVLFISLLVLFIYSLYALISGSLPRNLDMKGMLDSISRYSKTYNDLFVKVTNSMEGSGFSEQIKEQLLQLVEIGRTLAGSAVTGLFAFVQGIGGNLLNIILGMIVAFYLLKDIEYFTEQFRHYAVQVLKPKRYAFLADLSGDVNGVLSNFIRGQMLVCLIIGILSSIALLIVGLDFAVLVGMTAGLFNVIPYFGPLIGSLIAVGVGLLAGSPTQALLAFVSLMIVQQLDSNIISPKIVGDSVGIHPVFVILSIIIGGSYYGLLGMLLAVPTAGIIKVLLGKWITYRAKKREEETEIILP